MNISNYKQDCTGCGVCMASCRHEAINMQPDNFGFLYPHIDPEKCVDCGLCRKKCPVNSERGKTSTFIRVLAGVTRDDELLMDSSSGGAFTEIVKIISEYYPQFSVYGVTYAGGECKYIRIIDAPDLGLLRKSKYTQAKIGNTFFSIKKDLDKGIFTVFVGTPCHVAGLNAFLKGKKHENLLTIDLLCTGVCSPLLLEHHVKYMEHKNKCSLSSYDMRYKNEVNGQWHIMDVLLKYKDKPHRDKDDNLFIGCFRHHVAFRASCYRCKFTNTHREADMTIGDYWKNLDSISVKANKGASVVISNSKKGDYILAKLSEVMNVTSVSPEDIVAQQPALRHPVHRPPYNQKANLRNVGDSITFMKKNSRGPLKLRIYSFITHHILPDRLALLVKKIYYGMQKR